jgi:multiple sugar transport system permease protein
VLFVRLLITLMIPAQITAIRQFIIFKALDLFGTQALLCLPSFLGWAFGPFMLRQYFQLISQELVEAARIDGASLGRIFLTIFLPLSKPALVEGLAHFQTQYTAQWPLMMAAALVSVAAMIPVFLLAQRPFVSGIAATGLK